MPYLRRWERSKRAHSSHRGCPANTIRPNRCPARAQTPNVDGRSDSRRTDSTRLLYHISPSSANDSAAYAIGSRRYLTLQTARQQQFPAAFAVQASRPQASPSSENFRLAPAPCPSRLLNDPGTASAPSHTATPCSDDSRRPQARSQPGEQPPNDGRSPDAGVCRRTNDRQWPFQSRHLVFSIPRESPEFRPPFASIFTYK